MAAVQYTHYAGVQGRSSAVCKRGGVQEGGSTYYTMQEILGAEERGSTVWRRRVQEGGSQA